MHFTTQVFDEEFCLIRPTQESPVAPRFCITMTISLRERCENSGKNKNARNAQISLLQHAEKIGFLMFPAADESAEVVKPSEESLNFPAVAVATQFATVLGVFPAAIVLVGRNQQDTVLFCKR